MRLLALIASLTAACNNIELIPMEVPLAPPNPVPVLTLDVSPILPGQRATWTVGGLQPGERVNLLRASGLQSPGPCFAIAGGLCLDISGGISLVNTITANATGQAVLSLQLPSNLAHGARVAFQAVAVRGAGGNSSVKSVAVQRVIGDTMTTPVADLLTGDLVVTEIMFDPTIVNDSVGEWVEFVNLSGETVDLNGLRISDGGAQAFTITTSLVVGPDEFVVLGANTNTLTNGGVPVDLSWGAGFSLANTIDTVELSFGATIFDSVTYDDGVTFPQPSGETLSLDPSEWTEQANDEGQAWCAGTAGGTPGEINQPCPQAVCGDGSIGLGEECDDGGLVAGDGCDDLCLLEGCQTHELSVGTWHISAGGGRFATYTSQIIPDGTLILTSGDSSASRTTRLMPDTWMSDSTFGFSGAGSYTHNVAASSDKTWTLDEEFYTQTDSSGNIISQHRFSVTAPWSYDPRILGAETTADGSALVFGELNNPNALRKGFLARINSSGAIVWHKILDNQQYETTVQATKELSNGDIIMVGESGYGDELALARLSSNGTVVWNKKWRAASSVMPIDATEAPDGTIIVIGSQQIGIADHREIILALSSSGTLQWSRALDTTPAQYRQLSDVEVWPARCAAGVSDRGVCTEEGATCAGATTDQVCDCDGSRWRCATAGWKYVTGGSEGSRMTAYALSSTGSGLWGRTYGDISQLHDLVVGTYGELRMVGMSTRSGSTFAVTTTDAAQHAGCGETEVGAQTMSYPMTESIGLTLTQYNLTSAPTLWTPDTGFTPSIITTCETTNCVP